MSIVKKYFLVNGVMLWAWVLVKAEKYSDRKPTEQETVKDQATAVGITFLGLPIFLTILIYETSKHVSAYFKKVKDCYET